jgi:hypothetical protein
MNREHAKEWRLDHLLLVLIPCALLYGPLADIGKGLNNIASAIKTLKPTITLHEHPKEVQVIHTGLPRVAGRAE